MIYPRQTEIIAALSQEILRHLKADPAQADQALHDLSWICLELRHQIDRDLGRRSPVRIVSNARRP